MDMLHITERGPIGDGRYLFLLTLDFKVGHDKRTSVEDIFLATGGYWVVNREDISSPCFIE